MRAAALSHCPYALASNAAGIPSCAPAPAASCQPAAAPSPATQSGEGWTCELEGQKIRHNFKGAYLHAMGQPADGKTLQLSEAVELVTALPLKEVYDWLSDHQLNQAAPVDLRRVKPDSALLEEVFLGTRPVQGLADAEVRALHYAVPGAPPCPGLWGPEDNKLYQCLLLSPPCPSPNIPPLSKPGCSPRRCWAARGWCVNGNG